MTHNTTSYMLSEVPQGRKTLTPSDFNELYNTHYGKLYYWILSEVKNRDMAEDICAAAFANAFDHLSTLRDPSKFKSWLYQIARNETLYYWRRLKSGTHQPLTDDHNELPEPKDFTQELERYYDIKNIHAALKTMSAIHRKALLRFSSGLPCQGTMGSRLHVAKKILRQKLVLEQAI